MPKVALGDVVEMPTPQGLSYLQFTHRHPIYGELVRVLPGLYDERLDSFEDVVARRARFCTFFPLQAAVAKGIVAVVANEEIPAEARPFPLFRTGLVNSEGRVENWWLWDGDREWPVGKLTDEQRHLPIRGIWNDTLLVERIVSGWTPESDPS